MQGNIAVMTDAHVDNVERELMCDEVLDHRDMDNTGTTILDAFSACAKDKERDRDIRMVVRENKRAFAELSKNTKRQTNNTEENAEKTTGRKRANADVEVDDKVDGEEAPRPHTRPRTLPKTNVAQLQSFYYKQEYDKRLRDPNTRDAAISYDSNVVELAKKLNVDVSSIRMHVEPVVSEPCEPASASAYNYVTLSVQIDNVALCSMSDYMRNYIRAVEWRRSSNYSNGYDVEHSLPFTIVLVKCVRVEMPVYETLFNLAHQFFVDVDEFRQHELSIQNQAKKMCECHQINGHHEMSFYEEYVECLYCVALHENLDYQARVTNIAY